MTRIISRFLLGGILLFLVVACDPNRLYEQNEAIHDNTWNRDSLLRFEVIITDTITPCSIYLNVRNTGTYQFSNLYLFVFTYAPSGASMMDTVELVLADARGKWQGKGFGDVWDHQRLYKKNIRFPTKGRYIFSLQQAMREENLKGIMDAGIRIERISTR